MPLEGGLYQWAKLGFNELTGFLVAWNLWLFAILNTSEIGIQVTQYLGYIGGPSIEGLTESRWFVVSDHRDRPVRPGRRHGSRAQHRQVGAQDRRRADAGDVRRAAAAALAERGAWDARRIPPARDGDARHLDPESQPARQDGIWRAGRLRIRRDSCRRVPEPCPNDRVVGSDRCADHLRDVHLRHELGIGPRAGRQDRSDRADPAGADSGLRRARLRHPVWRRR